MKLYIPQNQKKDITEMQLSIMERELNELNEQFPLAQDQFDFKKVYSIKNDEGAEAYFYIRNNTEMNLNLEGLPIHMMKGDRLVAKANPDYKELGEIPSGYAAPFKIQFKTEDIYFPKYIAKGELVVGGELIALETVNTEIENLSENMDYYQKEFMKNYLLNLKNLRKDSFDINTISLTEGENGELDIFILVRNGYSHGIEIATLPLKVFNGSNLMIYTGALEEANLKVKKQSSKLFTLALPKNQLLVKEGDNYEEFRVEFK